MNKTYLNGPVSRVGHLEPDPFPPFVDPDRFLADHNRSGDLFIFEPFWFVSPFREHSLGGGGQERAVQGEREVVVDRGGADRVVDRHEKDAVREGAFDLNFVQQERDCLQSVVDRSAECFSKMFFDRKRGIRGARGMTHRLDVHAAKDFLPCECEWRIRMARCQPQAACASLWWSCWLARGGDQCPRARRNRLSTAFLTCDRPGGAMRLVPRAL